MRIFAAYGWLRLFAKQGNDRASSTRIAALLAAATLCSVSPARAGLEQRAIAQAGFNYSPGAQLPLDARIDDAAGSTTLGAVLAAKPALLLFVDYRCRSLCGVMLDELGDVLPKVRLGLGRDYNVVTVALDDAQTRADADAFRDLHAAGTILKADAHFLTAAREPRDAIEHSLGLVAPFDTEHRQFAHPAAVVVVDADGRAQQVLSPFALNALDVTLALTGASPSNASLGSRLLHLCYGWDPIVGRYTLAIERILSMLAAGTMALLALGVCHLMLSEKKRRREVG